LFTGGFAKTKEAKILSSPEDKFYFVKLDFASQNKEDL